LGPRGLLSLWSQVRVLWLLIWWPLEVYMVVNFRARGISRGARKLTRTLTLKKNNNYDINVSTHVTCKLGFTFQGRCFQCFVSSWLHARLRVLFFSFLAPTSSRISSLIIQVSCTFSIINFYLCGYHKNQFLLRYLIWFISLSKQLLGKIFL